jgi:hypothetical protein
MPLFLGGGDMIHRRLRGQHLERPAVVRGGHAEHRRRRRSWRAAIDFVAASASTPSRRTSRRCSSARPALEDAGPADPPPLAQERVVVLAKGIHRTTGTIVTAKASRLAPGTIARNRYGSAGHSGTAASFALYNSFEDVDALVAAVRRVQTVMG